MSLFRDKFSGATHVYASQPATSALAVTLCAAAGIRPVAGENYLSLNLNNYEEIGIKPPQVACDGSNAYKIFWNFTVEWLVPKWLDNNN